MRIVVGALFLALQLVHIFQAQTKDRRYFCWAPNDYVVEYTLRVNLGGRQLSGQEVHQRYRIRDTRADVHVYEDGPPEHLIDLIRQYERTYGAKDHAQIIMTWRLNGHGEQQEWQWPAE